MPAPLEQRDALAFERADDEPAGVTRDGRDGKAGQVLIGDRNGVLDLVGERAEAGAEHDAERRELSEAALAERFDGLVDIQSSFAFTASGFPGRRNGAGARRA